jgi:hypothetical protein
LVFVHIESGFTAQIEANSDCERDKVMSSQLQVNTYKGMLIPNPLLVCYENFNVVRSDRIQYPNSCYRSNITMENGLSPIELGSSNKGGVKKCAISFR